MASTLHPEFRALAKARRAAFAVADELFRMTALKACHEQSRGAQTAEWCPSAESAPRCARSLSSEIALGTNILVRFLRIDLGPARLPEQGLTLQRAHRRSWCSEHAASLLDRATGRAAVTIARSSSCSRLRARPVARPPRPGPSTEPRRPARTLAHAFLRGAWPSKSSSTLVAGCSSEEDLFGPDGVFTKLKGAVMERMLEAEMSEHLGHAP
jgi:hypothetical protein